MTRCHGCKRHGNGHYTLAVSDDGKLRCLWCECKRTGNVFPQSDDTVTGVVYTSFMDSFNRARTMTGRRLA